MTLLQHQVKATISFQSSNMSKKRKNLFFIGVIGLNIRRDDFYKKEISSCFCSYGAGRYDDEYEIKGFDCNSLLHSLTEKRNFEEVLNSISKKET